MPISRRRVTDATALKALAHPVRIALLELLLNEGARTATEAAAALQESPANCSWHLRKLADHGFVREVTGVPGRRRPWRAVTEALTWGDGDDGPQSRTVDEGLTDILLEREIHRLRAARAGAGSEPAEWRDATCFAQAQVWVTPEEARALSDDLTAVLDRYADRTGGADARPAAERLVSMVAWLVPSGPYARHPPPDL